MKRALIEAHISRSRSKKRRVGAREPVMVPRFYWFCVPSLYCVSIASLLALLALSYLCHLSASLWTLYCLSFLPLLHRYCLSLTSLLRLYGRSIDLLYCLSIPSLLPLSYLYGFLPLPPHASLLPRPQKVATTTGEYV
jgi:hypothetical protein